MDRLEGKVEWDKVEKTFERLKRAVATSDKAPIGQQVGEILFDLAGLANDWGLNAESLLREVNEAFIHRVEQMEKECDPFSLSIKRRLG